jgi:Uma2 family endonuclease
VARSLAQLVKRGVLGKKGRKYRFADPFFRAWSRDPVRSRGQTSECMSRSQHIDIHQRPDTLRAMATPILRTRRWSRIEYERLVDLGVFKPGERLELLDGALVVREPQGAPHMTGIRMAQEALRAAFGPGWEVRTQAPIALDDDSEPEPDVAVVPGSHLDYRHAHPTRPVLLVEVADSSLAVDRSKGSLYARAGVPDVWIINLVDDVLEVYRRPSRDRLSRLGWAYADVQTLVRAEFVSPLAASTARIAVTNLLP